MERPIAIVGGQVQWGHVSLIQWGQALGSLWSSVPEKTSELAGGGGLWAAGFFLVQGAMPKCTLSLWRPAYFLDS